MCKKCVFSVLYWWPDFIIYITDSANYLYFFFNICKFVWPVCGIFSFAVYPEMFDDLTAHINYFTYTLVAFSTGNVSCQDIKYLAYQECSYVNAKLIYQHHMIFLYDILFTFLRLIDEYRPIHIFMLE